MKKSLVSLAVAHVAAEKIVKNCGDCGKFVSQEFYVTIPNRFNYTHPLCRECMSNYDEVDR